MTLRRSAALLLAFLWGANPCCATESAVSVDQPRGFGHSLGDVLTQRVALERGRTLADVSPLRADRVGQWLERRKPRIETSQGRRWLCIDYQIINSPHELIVATLPAMKIAVKAGAPILIPGWAISIGPLTPDAVFALGDLQTMRPDQPAAPLPTAPLRQRLYLSLGMLALTATGWLLWLYWRNQRDSQRLPFARAAQRLTHLDASGAADSAEAWVALHRALNAAAGRAVQAESLSSLFARAPSLEPLRGDIEEFYRCSNERFFARQPSNAPFPLREFCRNLRRIEKSRDRARGI